MYEKRATDSTSPLAPQREISRVITNYEAGFKRMFGRKIDSTFKIIDLPNPTDPKQIIVGANNMILDESDDLIKWFYFDATKKNFPLPWGWYNVYDFFVKSTNSQFFMGLWKAGDKIRPGLGHMRQPPQGKTKLVNWARRECPEGRYYIGVFLDSPSKVQVAVRLR